MKRLDPQAEQLVHEKSAAVMPQGRFGSAPYYTQAQCTERGRNFLAMGPQICFFTGKCKICKQVTVNTCLGRISSTLAHPKGIFCCCILPGEAFSPQPSAGMCLKGIIELIKIKWCAIVKTKQNRKTLTKFWSINSLESIQFSFYYCQSSQHSFPFCVSQGCRGFCQVMGWCVWGFFPTPLHVVRISLCVEKC